MELANLHVPVTCSAFFKSIISYFPIPIAQLPRTVVKIAKCCLKYDSLQRPSAAENVAEQLKRATV